MSVQTEESWIEFTRGNINDLTYQGNVAEYYFDDFIDRIKQENVEIIEEVGTMPWGQKVIRFMILTIILLKYEKNYQY